MPVYVLDAVTKKISKSYQRSARIALVTDASGVTALDTAVVDAADEFHCGSLDGWQDCPESADAVVAFCQGERLLSGDLRSLRHLLLEPARQYYVPIHHPGVPALDLIAIEPRWGRRNPVETLTSSHWRIAAGSAPSAELVRFLTGQNSSWARLSIALWAAREDIGQGIDRLSALVGESMPAWMLALSLRNLIVLLWRAGRWQDGSALLERGMQMFPACAEFFFMAAVREWSAQRPAETLQFAHQAIEVEKKHGRGQWVGSGGEDSYRAHALIATVAEHLGDHKSAFYNFLPGLRTVPPFAESIHGILRGEIPGRVLDWLQLELRNLARRHPQYRSDVIRFLQQNHRSASAALLQEKTPEAPTPLLPMHPAPSTSSAVSGTPCLQFAGPLFIPGQDSRMARTWARDFARTSGEKRTFRLSNEEFTLNAMRSDSDRQMFAPHLCQQLTRLDLTIRLHEPPRFERPEFGRLAIVLPQQINAIPLTWNAAIERNVDHLLAPSDYVRNTLLRAGIPEAKIRVVPPLVESVLYTPSGERMNLGDQDTVFLFPGQCSYPHGIDLLLDAWDRAFTIDDRATLVIWHDGPGSSAAEALLRRIRTRAAQNTGAGVRLLDGPLSDERRAALLRSASVVVLPYRMEATAQTALEAIACGTPVITTEIGPALEVKALLGDAALFVGGTMQPVPLADDSRVVWNQPPMSFECNRDDLTEALRTAMARQDQLRGHALVRSAEIRRQLGEPSIRSLRDIIEELLG